MEEEEEVCEGGVRSAARCAAVDGNAVRSHKTTSQASGHELSSVKPLAPWLMSVSIGANFSSHRGYRQFNAS